MNPIKGQLQGKTLSPIGERNDKESPLQVEGVVIKGQQDNPFEQTGGKKKKG